MLTLVIATHGIATCSSSHITTPKKTNHCIFLPFLPCTARNNKKRPQAAAPGTHICAASAMGDISEVHIFSLMDVFRHFTRGSVYGSSRWPPNTSNPTETVVDPNGPSLGKWIHIPRFRFFDSILRFAVFLGERAQEEGTLPFMQKRAQFFFCIRGVNCRTRFPNCAE